MSIVLPTKKVKAERVNPKRIVIYSKPKTGKTTAYAGLEDNLIIDLENGSDYIGRNEETNAEIYYDKTYVKENSKDEAIRYA